MNTNIDDLPKDWLIERLDKFWSVTDCKHLTAQFVENGIPVASIQEVQSKFVNLGTSKKTTEFYYQKLIEGGRKPTTGDLIFSRNATVGEVAQVAEWHPLFALGQDVCLLRKRNQTYSTDYFQSVLKSPLVKRQLENLMVGSTFKRVNIEQIKDFSIPMPPALEQNAIATALSDTDALITSLEKLIAKKRNIKQGAMQELLKPKKGWAYKRVGDISSVGRGRVISHKEIGNSIKGSYPVYSSQTSNDGIMGYLDTYDFEGEYVTWTTDGANAGTVFYRSGKFNCTNVCGTIKLHVDNPQFIALVLNLITPKHVSRNLANPKLMNDPLKRIEVPLPPIDEQNRITSIIFDMEREINILGSKLEKHREIKSGMMQNLLTGKIRLV